MPVWSYVAQQVLAETLTADVRLVSLSPQAEVSGRVTTNLQRTWRLQYSTVTTAECASMAAFYATQRGAYLPFTFVSPNDQRSYQVRFDTAFGPELFQADLLALGDLLLVATSAADGMMLHEEWGYGELGYGGDVSSEVAPRQGYGGL